jgi:hypothetical protein
MLRINRAGFGLVVGATVATVGLALATSALLADDDEKLFRGVDHTGIQVAPEKKPANPDVGKSDEQRLAEHKAAHAQQGKFLQDFVASGKDPRALERLSVRSYGAPVRTLDESVGRASHIIAGAVTNVSYTDGENGSLPRSQANVTIRQLVKGEASQPEITVFQLGGPVPSNGGRLAQLETDELLLPGDEVVLLLTSEDGQFRALPGSGIIFFQNGVAAPEKSNLFGNEVRGKSLIEITSLLASKGSR